MREYETIIVLDPSVGEAGFEEEIGRVQNIITTRNGEVVAVEKWGKRKLAYEVNKKKEGIYALIRFKGHGEILSELEHRYKMNEQMLRHLTVVSEGPPPAPPAPPVAEGAAAATAAGEPAAAAGTAEPAVPVEPAAEAEKSSPPGGENA